jgi:hypothetical protein
MLPGSRNDPGVCTATIDIMTRHGSRLLDQAFVRSGPIRWLVVGGALLIAAITIGATLMAQNFRERALRNSGRELENTVMLLAHHFDQQLQDFAVIQKDFIDHVRATGITNAEDFRKRLSGEDIRRMLRSNIEALPHMGGVNIIDADGNLINSSTAWPAPKVDFADRAYFRTFRYDPYAPDMLIEPLHSRISGQWTIVIVRKIVAPNGEFIGMIGRGIEPASFEKFFEAVELGDSATIAMLHRDGTLLARYPHDNGLMGRNFRTGSFEQQADLLPRSLRRALRQSARRRGPADLLLCPAPFPDPDDGDHHARGGPGRLARADRHPDLDRHRLRAHDCRRPDRDRAQAAGAASPVAAAADAGKAAPRPRREQHVAGPVAVRRLAAARGLQPALHRHVPPVGRGGEARLQLPRHHRAPQGDRLLQRRRRS